jgi:4-alpha-glucanotransferase
MSEKDRALARLARLAGIATVYRDVWRRPRQASPETVRALLAAMGFSVDTLSGITAGIAEFEAADWGTMLPPVASALADDGAANVPLRAIGDGAVHWQLRLESGEERRGRTELDGLTVLAERREQQRRLRRLALPIQRDLPAGYHRLSVELDGESAETLLIVAPPHCHLPPQGDRRGWALTAQLYALRSRRNWGIGDFTDLAALAAAAARLGAAALGINPLHALFPDEPRHISPYSPSSRLFLNPLYLDIEAMPDFAPAMARGQERAIVAARAAPLVDYPAVAALKWPLFAALHRAFTEEARGGSARAEDFRRFQRAGGRALETFAVFTALHQHMLAQGGGFSWLDWPAALRDARSPEVARFAEEHRERVELQQYLQWEADRQLAGAAAAAPSTAGLYRDFAVGVDPNGADCWCDPELVVPGAAVGAPPDLLNQKGQNWGLAPTNPVALRRQAYRPFIAALRANMRHAGVLRLDHVMALMHLYWIPRGASAAEGTYVSYPFADLRRILALESMRQRCAVIGEDLGTVPDGFREAMSESGVLSYRVLLFERDPAGDFLPPQAYPELATASFSTHDIATLKGFWLGRDLEWRRELDLYPSAEAGEADRRERRRDRKRLLDALIAAGTLSRADARRLLSSEERHTYQPVLAEAVYRFLARSKTRLVLLQIEDVLGELEQPNLPGTIDEHPNWRRKLSRLIEEMIGDAEFARLAAMLSAP